MSGNSPISVESLIQGLQFDNPRLYQLLTELNQRLATVEEELFPLTVQSTIDVPVVTVPPEAPGIFLYTFTPTTVFFIWDEVPGAVNYEIRNATGVSTWEAASFVLRTTNLNAQIDALLVGSHIFLIKTMDGQGNYSVLSRSVVVTITPISGVTITKSVIDNNVLLNWTPAQGIFRIVHYEIYKDGVLLGTVDSTFFTRFENVAGTYTFRIIGVDVAGNRGPNSDIAVEVLTPPDYALQDVRTSALGGTLVDVLLLPGPKLLATWAATTWQVHFTSRAWLDPEDQVTAGFPIYIQPSNPTGSYEEVIDYGSVLTNVIAAITYNSNLLTPLDGMAVVIQMATSPDGAAWSAFTAGASQFLPSLRYLKFRLEFTGVSTKSLMEVYNVAISLSVKRENDGGEASALLTDVGGTTVNFNKAFKDVETITATPKTLEEPYFIVIDFVDIPNPVFFKVFVFDSTGNRVSKTIEWKARGIV